MTVDRGAAEPATGRSLDVMAQHLRDLRIRDGEPSFTDIAARVTQARVNAGVSPEAARVARSTIYDVFRPGRARVNVALVHEIASVLNADRADVEAWLAPAPATDPADAVIADQQEGAHPITPSAETTAAEPVVGRVPELATTRQILLLLAACVAINLIGRVVVDVLHLPIYLDMVGTAVAAMALGPWRGASVGAITNIVGIAGSGLVSLPFALVNVAGALVWGYGIKRFGSSLPRFLALNMLVALVSTIVAVPILVLAFDGTTGHGQDTLAATFNALSDRLVVAVGLANALTSVADKILSGFLALVALSALPLAMRTRVNRMLPAPPLS